MDLKRKRRSRLQPDRLAVSASLLLDERMKESVGLVSEDLFESLFATNTGMFGFRQSVPDMNGHVLRWRLDCRTHS